MIKEIRQHIKDIIGALYSDMEQNESAFYDGDIGESQIENTYQIVINDITTTTRTDFREQQIPVTVSLFGKGYRDEIVNYDELLDKAICINDNLLDIKQFFNVATIVNIESQNIAAEQLPGDENSFKVDINLTISTAYSLIEG